MQLLRNIKMNICHSQPLLGHRILNLYHHLPYLDTHTFSLFECPLAVVVLLLGPLLGPRMPFRLHFYSPLFWPPP